MIDCTDPLDCFIGGRFLGCLMLLFRQRFQGILNLSLRLEVHAYFFCLKTNFYHLSPNQYTESSEANIPLLIDSFVIAHLISSFISGYLLIAFRTLVVFLDI